MFDQFLNVSGSSAPIVGFFSSWISTTAIIVIFSGVEEWTSRLVRRIFTAGLMSGLLALWIGTFFAQSYEVIACIIFGVLFGVFQVKGSYLKREVKIRQDKNVKKNK